MATHTGKAKLIRHEAIMSIMLLSSAPIMLLNYSQNYATNNVVSKCFEFI